MSAVIQKPVIYTKSGHPLIVAPGTEKPLPADEWLQKIKEWRERNRECVKRISVEEFLADKHAEVREGLA